jgi:ketosteroid isomerase-like protein
VDGDREAIEALVYGYAAAIDAGDLETFGSLFADATMAIAGSPVEVRGAEAVRALVTRGLHWYDGTPRTRHITTNLVVALGPDGDRAMATSSVVVHQALADFPLQVILVAHYDDEFERVGGAWRFARRVLTYDLLGDLSRHFTKPVPDSVGSAGR